jgi:hypothetical protein
MTSIRTTPQWETPELGKALDGTTVEELLSGTPLGLAHDPSTNALIRHYRRLRGRN